MSNNIGLSFSSVAGQIYDELGGVCLSDFSSCLPKTPTDFCSASNYLAFAFNVATPIFALAGQLPMSRLAFGMGQLGEWVHSTYCLSPTLSVQQKGTQTFSGFANVLLVTGPVKPPARVREIMETTKWVTELKETTRNPLDQVSAESLHKVGEKILFLKGMPKQLEPIMDALRGLSDKISFVTQKLAVFENRRRFFLNYLNTDRDQCLHDILFDVFKQTDTSKLAIAQEGLSQIGQKSHTAVGVFSSYTAMLGNLFEKFKVIPKFQESIEQRNIGESYTPKHTVMELPAVPRYTVLQRAWKIGGFAARMFLGVISIGATLQKQHKINLESQSNITAGTCSCGSDSSPERQSFFRRWLQ